MVFGVGVAMPGPVDELYVVRQFAKLCEIAEG
jgi:hypothetical protein